MNNVKGILFDFGGTIDADGVAWKERFYPIYRAHGIKWKFGEFEKYFFASDDFLTAMKPRNVSYYDVLKLQVSLVLKEGGRFSEPLAGKIARKFLQDSLRSVKSKLPLIKKLSAKYKLGIVANFYGNLAEVCEDCGLYPYFDALADSGVVGCIKPDPGIFKFALKKLGTRAEETLFVGDSMKRDMAGAKNMGMPHIWVKPVANSGVSPCCTGDVTIGSIQELKGMLL